MLEKPEIDAHPHKGNLIQFCQVLGNCLKTINTTFNLIDNGIWKSSTPSAFYRFPLISLRSSFVFAHHFPWIVSSAVDAKHTQKKSMQGGRQ